MDTENPIPETKLHLHDTSTFRGRLNHFFAFTNPLLLFTSRAEQDDALRNYKIFKSTNRVPPGLTRDDIRRQAILAETTFSKDGSRSLFRKR